MADRKSLDATAFSVMVLCTALWGFQQVAIKLTAPDVSLVMQSAIRSIIATALLLAWIWLLTRYLAARLAVFSFLTRLTWSFATAAILVGVGISLVKVKESAHLLRYPR